MSKAGREPSTFEGGRMSCLALIALSVMKTPLINLINPQFPADFGSWVNQEPRVHRQEAKQYRLSLNLGMRAESAGTLISHPSGKVFRIFP